MGTSLPNGYSFMNKTETAKKTKTKTSGESKLPLDKRKPLMEAATGRDLPWAKSSRRDELPGGDWLQFPTRLDAAAFPRNAGRAFFGAYAIRGNDRIPPNPLT